MNKILKYNKYYIISYILYYKKYFAPKIRNELYLYIERKRKKRKNLYSKEVHLLLQCVHTYSLIIYTY